jgi:hypothetical protein
LPTIVYVKFVPSWMVFVKVCSVPETAGVAARIAAVCAAVRGGVQSKRARCLEW